MSIDISKLTFVSIFDVPAYQGSLISELSKIQNQAVDSFEDIVKAYHEADLMESFNWKDIVADCADNVESNDYGDSSVGRCFLGSVFALYPSGKYYTPFASGNVSESETYQDELFADALETIAESFGGWIESGEGDPCDIFFCLHVDSEESGEDSDYDTVDQIPSDYLLITDSQDISTTLESIGYEGDYGDYGCLFVLVGDGDYDSVYGCESSVPRLGESVDKLL